MPEGKPENKELEKLKNEAAELRKSRGQARAEITRLRKEIEKLEGKDADSLPINVDAEKAVLSCCLQAPIKAIPRAREKLRISGKDNGAAAFYLPAHRIIWNALLELHRLHGEFDLIILGEYLTKSGEIEKIGGLRIVADLLDDVPSVGLLDEYLRFVLEYWIRRESIEVSRQIAEQSREGDATLRLIKHFDRIEAIRRKILGSSTRSDSEVELIASLSSVAKGARVWLVSDEGSAKALREIGFPAVCPFGLDPSADLVEIFEGREVVAVIEHDDDETKEHNFIKRLLPTVARANWIPLKSHYPSLAPCSIAELLNQMRAAKMPDRHIIQQLSIMADEGRIPFGMVIDEIYEIGDRGGIAVRQSELADRLTMYHDLLHAGDFWQWGSEGCYKVVKAKEWIDSKIRIALAAQPETEITITSGMVDSVKTLMRSSNFCHPDELNEFDRPFLVNARNGMLDVLNGDLYPHARRYRSTTQSPISWNPKAECPNFLKWLETMKPEADEREQIQEMFGYCLVNDINYHVFFFLYGQGGTGKSTLVDLLQGLIGEENVVAVQLEELGNPFMRHKLVGKQVYLCGELTRQSFKHIGLIKQISAGEPISVDVKHREGFTFRPRGRFVMTSNVVAHTPDTSTGFERRFLQITFENQIARDQQDFNLPAKLQKELPGIMAWSVEGFQRLHKRGHFAHTKGNVEAIRQLMRHRNQIKSFVESPGWMVWDAGEDRGPSGGPLWCKAEDVLARFIEWAEHWGVKPFTTEQSPFMRELYRISPEIKAKARRCTAPGESSISRWFEGMYVPDLPEDLE